MKVMLSIISTDVGSIGGLLASSRALVDKKRFTELNKRFTVTD